jgi:hypothetical protein
MPFLRIKICKKSKTTDMAAILDLHVYFSTDQWYSINISRREVGISSKCSEKCPTLEQNYGKIQNGRNFARRRPKTEISPVDD